MNPEQFDQIVEAILGGKYSWACVLLLRFAGYNPLHYIPYRTYNRLLKENSRVHQAQNENIQIGQIASESNVASSCLSKIKDLAYLEVVGKQKTEVRGGTIEQWLTTQVCEYEPIKSESKKESSKGYCLELCEFT